MSATTGVVCPRCTEPNPRGKRECWVCGERLPGPPPPAPTLGQAAARLDPPGTDMASIARDAFIMLVKIIAIGAAVVCVLIGLLLVTCFGLLAGARIG